MEIRGQIDDLNIGDTFEDNDPGLEPTQVFTDSFGDDDKKTDEPHKPVDNPFKPENDNDFDEPVLKNKIVEDLLKQKGILDLTKVLYENEAGETEEVNFYDLPYEDQINILSNKEEGDGISEEDMYYLQQAKENNISLTELIQYYLNQSIEEYNKNQEPSYAVSDYSDEELYVADMKAKLGDSITDEEILRLLEKELEIPEIFKKKVDKLREEYINIEESERSSLATSIQDKKNLSFKEFGDTISSLVDSVEDIGGVGLEDTDKNDILKFLVEQDVNGSTAFQKLMNDPENIFLAAWAILKAQDTFDVLKDHYEGLLKTSKKTQPIKTIDKGTQALVVRSTPKAQSHMSIEDLQKFED